MAKKTVLDDVEDWAIIVRILDSRVKAVGPSGYIRMTLKGKSNFYPKGQKGNPIAGSNIAFPVHYFAMTYDGTMGEMMREFIDIDEGLAEREEDGKILAYEILLYNISQDVLAQRDFGKFTIQQKVRPFTNKRLAALKVI